MCAFGLTVRYIWTPPVTTQPNPTHIYLSTRATFRLRATSETAGKHRTEQPSRSPHPVPPGGVVQSVREWAAEARRRVEQCRTASHAMARAKDTASIVPHNDDKDTIDDQLGEDGREFERNTRIVRWRQCSVITLITATLCFLPAITSNPGSLAKQSVLRSTHRPSRSPSPATR
ncbi:hypothetical protein GALMADRAFT_917626 [Galerina marginata CBS 339.88]|uniref:Uncharacterized protein n=1 Tax=Galerina marginata (strain CBS 339.88) TaxID=685588 RepID=A0A067SFE7_GALM3|nr:hypothetical protein GALMADRAFT_917626 [Galerina marginata CBS 339.88]